MRRALGLMLIGICAVQTFWFFNLREISNSLRIKLGESHVTAHSMWSGHAVEPFYRSAATQHCQAKQWA